MRATKFSVMRQVLNDIEAGKVTDELRRRGIPARQRLRVVVESIEAEEPSLTAINAAGGAFNWLAEEPDLYSDADLVERFQSSTGIPFGAIILTDFPFTDLTAAKRRPALVISGDNDRRTDVIVAYITSIPRGDPDAVAIAPTARTGLKVKSSVRFDKIATINKDIIAGRIGNADPIWLNDARKVFFGVFGFGSPVR